MDNNRAAVRTYGQQKQPPPHNNDVQIPLCECQLDFSGVCAEQAEHERTPPQSHRRIVALYTVDRTCSSPPVGLEAHGQSCQEQRQHEPSATPGSSIPSRCTKRVPQTRTTRGRVPNKIHEAAANTTPPMVVANARDGSRSLLFMFTLTTPSRPLYYLDKSHCLYCSMTAR